MASSLSSIFHTVVTITLLSFCAPITYSQTAINGIWVDDFLIDPTQLNGWYISSEVSGDLGNIIVQGSRNYHGKFSRIGDKTGNGNHNTMQRKFKCVSDSKVYISYKFAYCKTEDTDTITMNFIGATSTSRQNTMNWDSSPSVAVDLSTIETTNIFATNIQPIRIACDHQNKWNYQEVDDEYVGIVEAQYLWQLNFIQKLSGTTEYSVLFDIAINCDRLTPVIVEPIIVETTTTIGPIIIEPITVEPVDIVQKEFCCHTSKVDFEMWNGYCLMKTDASECNDVTNNRCEWNENDCFPNPECLMRDIPCVDNNACCSKACLFQNVVDGSGGRCR